MHAGRSAVSSRRSVTALVALLVGYWGTAGLCAAEPLALAQLPYATHCRAQAGSGNLLPNADFAAGLKGWDPKGDVSLVEMDGQQVLRFGPQTGTQQAHIRVYVPQPRAGVMYLWRWK